MEYIVLSDGLVCMAPAAAEADARNKGEQLRWAREARQQLDYYRGEGQQ